MTVYTARVFLVDSSMGGYGHTYFTDASDEAEAVDRIREIASCDLSVEESTVHEGVCSVVVKLRNESDAVAQYDIEESDPAIAEEKALQIAAHDLKIVLVDE